MDEGTTRHDKKVWVRGYSFCEPHPFCKVWSLLVSGLTSKWHISPEGPVRTRIHSTQTCGLLSKDPEPIACELFFIGLNIGYPRIHHFHH